MNVSDCIQPVHLSRLAVVYVRQSSPQQIVTNTESLKLQYNLAERARAYGWKQGQVHIIDSDLGRSGRTTEGRPGFKELVTMVTVEQVGILFAYDVTRLARNCTDWYQLLDLCGYRHCLVGDQDGIYDPGTPNGRLILGLKGLISELELHTIRRRLTDGLLNKAQRGELAQPLPAGLVRDPSGQVHKEPNQEVQSRLDLLFATCLRVQSATKVVRFFHDRNLLIPRRNSFGDVVWRPVSASAIYSILKNPAYAGAFAYGRTQTVPRPGSQLKPLRKRLALAEWKILVRDKYPAYIDWETFEKIQAMLRDNHSDYQRQRTRGVPRSGRALLHGLVYCGHCGHKMFVDYKRRTRYFCKYLRQEYQARACQNLPADPIDDRVAQAFLEALAPAELDVYTRAVALIHQEQQHVQRSQGQQIERLRYQARLAERQFNQADPDNRLVAAELEKRWEKALRELKDAEDAYQRQQLRQPTPTLLSAEVRKAFREAGENVPDLWRQDLLSQAHKKALLRCLIDKVVLQRLAPDTIQARIVWKGGDTTTYAIPVAVGALAQLSSGPEMEKLIVKLARQGQSDVQIAERLTREGHRSPKGATLMPSTVRTIRLRHGIYIERSQSHPRRISGHLTVSQLARKLNTTPHWIHDRIHNGTIQVTLDPDRKLYLFPDQPKTVTMFKQLLAGKLQKLRF
jgi:DNA invertase Pin-like site-specific DNA recombinase